MLALTRLTSLFTTLSLALSLAVLTPGVAVAKEESKVKTRFMAIGDADGAAPMLVHVKLNRNATARAFEAIIDDVRTLLDCELIHGDLSAYNILYHRDRPRLIDLPQASAIKSLADPWPMFYRDIANICQHFERQGLERDPLRLAQDLWEG